MKNASAVLSEENDDEVHGSESDCIQCIMSNHDIDMIGATCSHQLSV